MGDTYQRAKNSILSQILSYPTISNQDWVTDRSPEVGEIVSMNSAPDSKWYLSWFMDIDTDGYTTRYLLKSIEDGEMCWWGNVGINVYRPRISSYRDCWKWSDKQFAFNDRWMKVCFKWNDAWLIKPYEAKFTDENGVILSLYKRHDFDRTFKHEKTFGNWKKVTMKMMDEFYRSAVEEHSNDT